MSDDIKSMGEGKVESLWEKAQSVGMRRRKFLYLLGAGGAAAVLAACSTKATPLAPTTSSTKAVATAPPTTAAVIKWKGQHSYTGKTDEILVPWDAWIKYISKGNLQIDYAAPAAIVPITDVYDAVSNGVLDIAAVHYGTFHAQKFPLGNIEVGPPMTWQSSAETWDCMYNPQYGLFDLLQKEYAKHNIKYFVGLVEGCYHLAAVTFKPDTPDSIKGKKIRATGVFADYVAALGGAPVNIPGPDLYTAMKTGVVDGAVYNMYDIDMFKDVWKYYVVDPVLAANTGSILINMDTWNKLPIDLRDNIDKWSPYLLVPGGTFKIKTDMWKAVAIYQKQYGFQTITWSAADKARVFSLSQTLWDKLASASPESAQGIDMIKRQMRDLGRI